MTLIREGDQDDAHGERCLPQYIIRKVTPNRVLGMDQFFFPFPCFSLDILLSFDGVPNPHEAFIINKH
jgi:hypothetical protein